MQHTVDELVKAGAHFGYNKSRRHPSIAPYVYSVKNGVDIINLEKTIESLEEMKKFLADFKGKNVLLVGTKPEAIRAIDNAAMKTGSAFVSQRWVGGLLTNWSEMKKRVSKLVDFKDKRDKGELGIFTKKEQLEIVKNIGRMEVNFIGVVGIEKQPEVLIVIDPKKEHVAVKEAFQLGIPVVALANTDCSIKGIRVAVVANDASVPSIEYFMSVVTEALSQ
ncbi:MAG: 30S ribosomal protein S2 [Candidatus Pacebacteria bacterium]|nr:30S ribosomal protein S2 [Candidatus Paceibacterota bacterium]MBP9770290.1 30S ribosomal protein S2 [Candidatus Paceibacterota bacterium]